MEKGQIGWNDLFRNGSVVDLDVGEWRARLKLKAKDLGIPDTTEVHKALALGSHRLAPKERFEEIREIMAEAKRAVEYHSMNFLLIKGARFTPDEELAKLLPKLRNCVERLVVARKEFADNIGAIRGEWLPVLRKSLEDAAHNPEAAKAAYDRIVAEYPTPEQIEAKFYIKWNIYSVSGAKSDVVGDALAGEAETVKSVVRSMVEQLREEFAERLSAVTSAVAKGGKLNSQTIESTREVLNRVETMNLFEDRVLTDQIAKLRNIVDVAEANGKIYSNKKSGFLTDLSEIQTQIEKSVEEAVADAEASLTGVGRRKFNLPKLEVS